MDLLPVIIKSLNHSFLMRKLEQEPQYISKSIFYTKFYSSNGHWNFPIHDERPEYQSLVTPIGFYTPKRLVQGTINPMKYLKSTISSMITDDLLPHVLFSIDDIVLHHTIVHGMFDAVKMLLVLINEKDIMVHLKKCCFFSKSIRWCGRMISKDGIRFDPRIAPHSTTSDWWKIKAVCLRAPIGEDSNTKVQYNYRANKQFMDIVYERSGARATLTVCKVLF